MINQKFETNDGPLIVTAYRDKNNVAVCFLNTGGTRVVRAAAIRSGNVKDYFKPSLFGRGYIGNSEYTHGSLPYKLWHGIHKRCYSDAYAKTYGDCEVSTRWHHLKNFADDIIQMDNWNIQGFDLDKDLKIIGNKTYGIKGCSFVPSEVNRSFAGARFNCKPYQGKYVIRFKGIKPKTFDTRKEAVACYIELKSESVYKLARKYKDDLDIKVYRNLLNPEKLIREICFKVKNG